MTVSRVVIATLDTVADRMAGPAIRCWESARMLTDAGHDVRLVSFGRADRPGEGFIVEHVTVGTFRQIVEWADVLVIQGILGASFPWLHDLDVVVVVDLYDPFHIEILEVEREEPAEQRDASFGNAMRELHFQLDRGDVFLCASERQRDLWIGHLAAVGRINRETFDSCRDLENLVRLAPFGIDPTPPQRTGASLRDTISELGSTDRILLWAGGVYNWFDPVTLVEAVDLVSQRRDDVRLVFMGMTHPNPDVPRMRAAVETERRSNELGLTGTRVFFMRDWVPYDSRGSVLLDADIGVSCHLPGLETRYSFRTRMLDYLWSGLPIVCTEGDVFADLVRARDLGEVVPPQDAGALADALIRVLEDDDPGRRSRIANAAAELVWPEALSALREICDHPQRAADSGRPRGQIPPRYGLISSLRTLVRVVRQRGWGTALRKIRAKIV